MNLTDNARGALYMNVAMASFTLGDTCMKAVTAEIPTFQAAFLRGIPTMIALIVLARYLGGLKLWFPGRDGVALSLRNVGEILGTVTFLIALKHMPLANLSAIMQSLPLAVTLVAAVVLREPVGWRRMTAISIGFLGVMLIVRPGTDGFDEWSILGLLSVGSVVLRDLSTRRLSRAVPSVSVAFYAALSVTAISAILLPFTTWVPVEPHHVALILAASAFLITGHMFIVSVMRVGEIGFVAPFRYTALVWAILLGWLVFGQFPDRTTLIGSAIVVSTGIFTLYRERARLRRGPAPLRLH